MNSIADVAGVLVGQAEDARARTGVTVVLGERPLRAVVDVRGGAPGTIGTDALRLGGLIEQLDAVVLAGGSAFGLEAAAGVLNWLAAQGRGFSDWGPPIPLVAGAILFDLNNGGDKGWGELPPYRRLGAAAAAAAGRAVPLGNRGAGFGAMAGPYKGGLGSASARDPATGITIGALVAVNAVGSPTMPGLPTMWAWHLEQDGEAGGQPPPARATGHDFETKRGLGQRLAPNTTIGVIATDADLDRGALLRLAIIGQDGLAAAIRPIHTQFDGDALFALTTAAQPRPAGDDVMIRLGTIAADVVARAVMRGVHAAEDLGDMIAYRTRWGTALGGRAR